MMTGKEVILTIYHKYSGDWDKIYEHIKNKTPITEDDVSKAKNWLEGNDLTMDNVVTIIDKDYPDSLKQCFRPPFVFFIKIYNKDSLNQKRFYLIGNLNLKQRIEVLSSSCGYKILLGDSAEILTLAQNLHDAQNLAIGFSQGLVIYSEQSKQDVEEVVHKCLCSGKDVFVNPTSYPSYNNKLIKDGAYLFDSVEDLAAYIN